MSDTPMAARPAWRLWPLALGMAALAASAPAAAPADAELDCSELAALQRLPADAAPAAPTHYLHVEELFYRLLTAWPARGDADTAAGLSDLEQRLAERLECLGTATVRSPGSLPRRGTDRPGALFLGPDAPKKGSSPFTCLTVIEGRTLEPLFERRPRTALAVARLYQRKQAHQIAQQRLRHARRSLEQVRALLGAYLAGAGTEADTSAAATVLSLAAFALAGLPTIGTTERAIEILHDAVELDRDHLLAHYLAAHYEEKRADYPHARGHLERLDTLSGGDSEIRLRRGVILAHLGRTERARRLLEELVGASPDWVAIVASQRLANLLVEEGRAEEAAARLRSALERFPHSSQLQLQLARLLHTDWRSSWPLVDGVLNGWTEDRGEPARIEYERERLGWVRDAVTELDRALREAREEVAAEATTLRRRPVGERRGLTEHVEGICRGALPLRRLPGDPGTGPFAPGSPGSDR